MSSFPNHVPPHHPRPITSTPQMVNNHPLNEAQKRNLFIQHSTAGIAAFTLGRLFVMVPSQNYKNAAILSGSLSEEPSDPLEGQQTEVARVFSEYALKNVLDRAFINYSGLSWNVQEPICRFTTSLLLAPLHASRVREARGEKTPLLESYQRYFSVERLLFLALHETVATILSDKIYDAGLFTFEGYYNTHWELNLRLSQFASRVLLTPLEAFAKRVAVSDSTGDLWKEEYERMKEESKDLPAFLKYLGGIALWAIPESLGMVVEKMVYRQIVDRWPVKQTELENRA